MSTTTTTFDSIDTPDIPRIVVHVVVSAIGFFALFYFAYQYMFADLPAIDFFTYVRAYWAFRAAWC